MCFILILALLVCIQVQVFAGSTAVTPVFVQKGHDVLLEVRKDDVPEGFLIVSWNFNKKPVLTVLQNSEPQVREKYSGRVEFSVENYSLKLKNVQETDSGLYDAQVRDIEDEQILAKYNITVQDPVSPVVLTVDSVSRSTNLCNLTVTCRTQDSHISSTFTCDNQTCSQEEGERSKVTASGASLQVYLVNDSIICNHSNQVSWTKNQEQTKICVSCPRYCVFAGSTAVTPVFVQKGDDVLLTCWTQDSHISGTFTCDNQTCSQEEGERSKVTASGASLQVYLVNDSIICNHSNQVSWTENQEQTKIWNFCPRHCGSENLSAGFSYCLVKTVVFSVGLIIMVSAVIGVHLMETFKKKNQEEMKKQ
ncbi:uncharacterized protein [Channa argus]|uniref:uncharacterized protein isoform X1 n=2 Tax=Channa argus TaxID=215402 RepID=UPI0035227F51